MKPKKLRGFSLLVSKSTCGTCHQPILGKFQHVKTAMKLAATLILIKFLRACSSKSQEFKDLMSLLEEGATLEQVVIIFGRAMCISGLFIVGVLLLLFRAKALQTKWIKLSILLFVEGVFMLVYPEIPAAVFSAIFGL